MGNELQQQQGGELKVRSSSAVPSGYKNRIFDAHPRYIPDTVKTGDLANDSAGEKPIVDSQPARFSANFKDDEKRTIEPIFAREKREFAAAEARFGKPVEPVLSRQMIRQVSNRSNAKVTVQDPQMPKSNFYTNAGDRYAQVENDPGLPPVRSLTPQFRKAKSIFRNDATQPLIEKSSKIYLKQIDSEQVERAYPQLEIPVAPLDHNTVSAVASQSRIQFLNPDGSHRAIQTQNSIEPTGSPLEADELSPSNIRNYRAYSPLKNSQATSDAWKSQIKTERFNARRGMSPNRPATIADTNRSKDQILQSELNLSQNKTISQVDARNTYQPDGLLSVQPGSIYDQTRKLGYGKVSLIDQYEYEGELLDGKMEGHGKMTFPDGSTFIGQFSNGKRNGLGRLFNKQGELVEQKDYKNESLI